MADGIVSQKKSNLRRSKRAISRWRAGAAENHELMAAVMADHVNVAYGAPMQHWSQDAMYVRRVQELILNQVNYYFSTENLCKDEFLRLHMDGEGWVPIPLLASFARLRRLTTDLAILTEARGATALQLLHTTPSPPLPVCPVRPPRRVSCSTGNVLLD